VRSIVKIGDRYGRLTVLSFYGKDAHGNRSWRCLCQCGNQWIVSQGNIRSGKAQSCGCYRREKTAKKNRTHGCAGRGKPTPEYRAWHGMMQRCYYKKSVSYRRYGAKGIKVHPCWHDFVGFLSYLQKSIGRRPNNSMTLDRINNRQGYEPGNIRWASRHLQRINQSAHRLRKITYKGKALILKDWALKLGINYSSLYSRLSRGWSVKDAFSFPKLHPHEFVYWKAK